MRASLGSALSVLLLGHATLAHAVDLSSTARREILEEARYTLANVSSAATTAISELDEAALELSNGVIGTIEYCEEVEDAAVDVQPDLSEIETDAGIGLTEIGQEEAAEFGLDLTETQTAVTAYYGSLLTGSAASVTPKLSSLIAKLQAARLMTVTVSPTATTAIDAAIAGIQAAPLAP